MMALSWSRISDYRQCPHKFKMKYITKEKNFILDQKDKNYALVRGGNIHKALENYVKDRLAGLNPSVTMPEIIRTQPFIDDVMANYNVIPESQIAIDENFNQVSWYDKSAWFRVIYDLIGFGKNLLLTDYKTGKLADYSGSVDELGQLHMSSLVGMALWPEYEDCSAIYVYVDHTVVIPCLLNRAETFEPMKEQLIKEHAAINADEEFRASKNQFCKWCEAIKEQCAFK